MTRKDAFLVALALYVLSLNKTETGAFVAVTFKHRRFKTDAGRFYVVGGRGIYRYIHCAWDRLTGMGLHAQAKAVATAFTKADGTYAYL